MSKVLFIRSNPSSPRVEKEADSLVREGHSVSLFLWNRYSNTSKHKVEQECNIYEFGLKAPFGAYKLVFYWVVWWCAIFIYLLRNKFDIIHVCGFDSYPPVILNKLVKRNIIIYDIFDFFGASLPSKTPHIIQKIISKLERSLLRFADAVIIVDESREVQLKGAKIPKLEVIMNCVSDEDYNFSEYKESNGFTIFYGGMISKTRGLKQLVEAIKDEEDIKLIIAGFGEDEVEFKDIFNSYTNIEFLGHVTHNEAIRLTYQSDAVFGFYDPIIPNNRLASPNKLFEAMMCKTPIIVNGETTMADIVRRENCGIIVPYSDELALKKAIVELKNNPEMCKKMGESGRNAFEREYNWEVMEKRLLNLYKYCIDQD
ncbi:MAG: glycosyltransferase family 4 protein, partial [Candidatus Thermoplasmatota archaeon]|nr:glycosyltransferase family 4 protein [Candidatus Thermoplasmatota archaeon]